MRAVVKAYTDHAYVIWLLLEIHTCHLVCRQERSAPCLVRSAALNAWHCHCFTCLSTFSMVCADAAYLKLLDGNTQEVGWQSDWQPDKAFSLCWVYGLPMLLFLHTCQTCCTASPASRTEHPYRNSAAKRIVHCSVRINVDQTCSCWNENYSPDTFSFGAVLSFSTGW